VASEIGIFGYNGRIDMRSLTLLLASLVVLMGCARGWQASNQRDYKAKKFGYPRPDRAKIYVYREAESGPSLLRSTRMELFLDGMPAGSMKPGSFALLTVRPGPHTLFSRSQGEDAELKIDATGGGVYYVSLERFAQDSLTGSELLLVDRETGREAIRDLRLINDPPPPVDPLSAPSLPPLHDSGPPSGISGANQDGPR
jgi:hypothetical protein